MWFKQQARSHVEMKHCKAMDQRSCKETSLKTNFINQFSRYGLKKQKVSLKAKNKRNDRGITINQTTL